MFLLLTEHDQPRRIVAEQPCPDCNGTGIMSCCDGAVLTEADVKAMSMMPGLNEALDVD
jgi:hypothetical protein